MIRTWLMRLQVWSRKSANRGMFVSSLIVGTMTLIVKGSAFLKDLLVAQHFGVSSSLDAYFVAFIIPSFLMNVVAGAFYTSLVPTYIEVRQRDGEIAAQALFSTVITLALGILGGCTLVFAFIGPFALQLLGSGFDPETSELSRQLFWVMIPSIVISGMAMLWSAALNADEKYALASIAPGIVPVITVLFLVLTAEQWGVYSLALGTVSGFFLQAFLLAISLRRRGFSIHLSFQGVDGHAVQQIMGQFFPAVASGILISGSELVDQAMATPLGAGSVSALNFGIKIMSFVIAIGGTALSVTALTHFSKLIAAKDWWWVRRTFRTYTFLILLVTIPIVLGVTLFSESIVRLLYERGAFKPDDTLLVSQIQIAFFVHLPFYLLVILVSRLLSALKMQVVFLWGAIINFTLNIALNYIFIQWFGVVGIALSTSCVFIISFCFLFVVLSRKLSQVEARKL